MWRRPRCDLGRSSGGRGAANGSGARIEAAISEFAFCGHSVQLFAGFSAACGAGRAAISEDRLVGVARQMEAARELKRRFPNLLFVGTAYSYLQDFLPHVAQAALRSRKIVWWAWRGKWKRREN